MMQDDFYTMGGGHFWEDIFFYQKWRIQRNFVSKKCRLLDNWDICRQEGDFDECYHAFLKYIETFEIVRQKGHMIVMLPGWSETKNIFKPLWRAALRANFMAAAINYPSSQKSLDSHVRQIEFFLNHLEDVDTVSFVTKGVSCLILRKLFEKESAWQSRIKVGRIVEVAPLNYGSRLIKKMCQNKILRFIIGPMGEEMDPQNICRIPLMPKKYETGIILCESSFVRFFEFITRTKMPLKNPTEEKELTGATDAIRLSCHRLNIFKNYKIVDRTIKFITKGSF